MTRRLLMILVLLQLLTGFWAPVSTPAAAAEGIPPEQDEFNILILHSYHPGYPWTDQIMSGMQRILSSGGSGVNTYVEYLDTKRHTDNKYFSEVLSTILRYKLSTRSFDLVMVSDNEALNFVFEYRDDLFPDIPIVFSGINNYCPSMVDGHTNTTGAIEKEIYPELLEQALDLFPATRKIVVISSIKEPCAIVNYGEFTEASERVSEQVEFIFWIDLPANQIATRLLRLPKDSLVFINAEISDQQGNVLSFEEKMRLINESARVPIFSAWDVYLNHGIVGGTLISAEQQGETAARMALQILSGIKPKDIPVAMPSIDPPIFDYRTLQQFNIAAGTLPQPHTLINAPPSFYRLSKLQATFAALTFSGSIGLSLVLVTNILRRKNAERSLRANEQKYRELSQQFEIILTGISHGLTLIDREMRVVWSNMGSNEYVNEILGSIPGEYCCKLLYNRKTLCENCPAIESFETGETAEAIIRTPDSRILETKSFPLKNADQQITHVIMLVIDVTEKNRLQQEAIFAGRLASLGELAAGIAHEINNPNGLILLNIDLLRKVCHDTAPILQDHYQQHGDFILSGIPYSEMMQELPHLFSETIDSANRIRRIVEDLKDFTRAESPELEQLVDINEAAQAAERLVRSSIKPSQLVCSYESDIPHFMGNEQRIEQVIINLLVNACQALTNKQQRVFLKTWYRQVNNTVVLQVRDEGCGISSEHLKRLSEPFFTTKRKNGGTGLGLSVSARIIKDHGGSLSFISKPGQGTTAILFLPAHLEAHINDDFEGEPLPEFACSTG